MANVLVTGGAGYVGSVCCAELLKLGHSVTIVDDLSTGFKHSVPAGAVFLQIDIGDRALLEPLVRDVRFDVVFHFAAKALIAESMSNPGYFFEQNVAAGITMLEVLRRAQIRKFVFSSSSSVYGIPEKVPIDEDDPNDPINAYGESKLMFERVLQWYARAYGWSVIAFRYFNAAGGTDDRGENHDPETHVIPLLLQTAARERDGFSINGDDYPTSDGTCVRDYVHVLDIAHGHICALKKMDQPGMRAYNIGLGTSYSVRQLCDAVEKVVGHSLPISIAPRREGDPPILCASPRRIMAELGWKPKHSSLDEIISSAWKWKQKQRGAAPAIAAAK
jgi:UDP-glucose 4-epimerase